MSFIRKAKTYIRRKPVPAFTYNPESMRKKRKLRDLGYKNTMTLYGVAFQNGKMRRKRIEVCSKRKIRQVHNAALYETMVSQDLTNPATISYHQRFDILSQAHFKGIPKEDFLVLTWRELLAGKYEALKGEWVEYDQET